MNPDAEPDSGSVQLNYDIIPGNAPAFAADIVRDAKRISHVILDYSVESLAKVDEIIEGFRADGTTSDKIPGTLFGFGCYVGEVFVRNAGYVWRATQPEESKAISMPLVIERESAYVLNPIGKVFKRMTNGDLENLAYFYRAMSEPPVDTD